MPQNRSWHLRRRGEMRTASSTASRMRDVIRSPLFSRQKYYVPWPESGLQNAYEKL